MYIPKENTGLPTVSTELTFIAVMITANNRRKVCCYDVPSAFVNMDINEDMIMVLKGEQADMMIQIAPEVYRKYVALDKKVDKSPLCEASEGIVRTDAGKPTILQEAEEGVRGIWANHESVRSVRSKHGYESRKATHGNMAR